MGSKINNKGSRIVRYMKMPIRILGRAREFYEKTMMGCAGKVSYGSAMGSQFSTLPRSFSVKSTTSEEDFRELVRVSSTGSSTTGLVSPNELLRFKKSPAVVPRSNTVGIGRIDEDRPCEFGVNDVGFTQEIYPRSRSYAGSIRRGHMV